MGHRRGGVCGTCSCSTAHAEQTATVDAEWTSLSPGHSELCPSNNILINSGTSEQEASGSRHCPSLSRLHTQDMSWEIPTECKRMWAIWKWDVNKPCLTNKIRASLWRAWVRLGNEVFLREASGTWEHLRGHNKMQAAHEKGTIMPVTALGIMQTLKVKS